MGKQANIPELRFPEFTLNWEEMPLGKILKSVSIKNSNGEYQKEDMLSISSSAGVVNQMEYKGRSFAGESVLPYNILKKGQVVYTKSPLRDFPYGIIKYNTHADGIVSTLYAIYSVKKGHDGLFIDYYFQLPERLNKYLKPLVNIGAKNDMKVNNDKVLTDPVIFPRFEEQQKIASFFAVIDQKIQDLKKKKDLLEEYKKGVAQKLFSQKIRFKDGAGNEFPRWKRMFLGDVFKERSEKGFPNMELLSVSIDKGVYPQTEGNKSDNSSSDKSSYKRVLKEDIAYNSMRMWQGASAKSEYDGIVSPAYTVLKGNKFNNSSFFAELFKTTAMINTFQKYSQGLTSDTWNLKYNALAKIEVMVPHKDEQLKIATCLLAINRRIGKADEKLQAYETWKKGLLQKMFC